MIQDRFDFDLLHVETDCGTAGCAMGELPAVYPKIFSYVNGYLCFLNDAKMPIYELEMNIGKFFGLTEKERYFLFYPNWGCNNLSAGSTKEEVAKHIREFVKGDRYPCL